MAGHSRLRARRPPEPRRRPLKEAVFEHARLQPFVDHPANDAVRDSPVEKRTEVMMLPAQPLSAHEGQTQRTQGLMRRPPRPEAE